MRAIVTEHWLTEAILRAARDGNGDFLPWQGSYQRVNDLTEKRLLIIDGISIKPPFVTYALTDAGRKYLRMLEAEHRRQRTAKAEKQP